MIAHERLVEEVTARARLTGTGEAVRVVRVTLAALARRLEEPARQRLRQALPGPERDAATSATVPATERSVAALLREVGRNLDASAERARHLTRSVLSLLAAGDKELGREVRDGLPAEFAELFSAPEADPERRHPATNAPAPLTREELDSALRRRPQWNADGNRLLRTVALPEDRLPPLLRRIDQVAREINHHPEYQRSTDGVTFALRTHSVDAVTALDLDLADRIDAAVSAVGSGGHPG